MSVATLPRYPDDLSSIPRANQSAWLDRPSTPLVLDEVFNRRKNLVTSDLHVLLVTPDKSERLRMRSDLDSLGYKITAASSGKTAQDMLSERGGEFHVVMISVALSSENSAGEGPDCVGLLAWARDMPVLKEVSMIVLGGYSIDASLTIELIRCGALDVLTKPVPVEALHRLRALVGTTQSLAQQRYASRGEGGARLVTSYLLKKERENPENMGLPTNALDRHGDSNNSTQLGEVTVSVLLMQRDTRKSGEVPAMLRECGFTVGAICRTKNEVMKAFSMKGASWNLFMIEMGPESTPGVSQVDPKFAEFFAAAQAVLREMSMRQILLPAIAVQEEKSTDSVVRTMRLGVVDAVLPPFSKHKMRYLLRYVLKPADLRWLHETSKRLHAQQQSGLGGIGSGDGGGGGGGKRGVQIGSSGGGLSPGAHMGHGSSRQGGRSGSSAGSRGASLSRQSSAGNMSRSSSMGALSRQSSVGSSVQLTAAASAAAARMDGVKSVPVGRGKGVPSGTLLNERQLNAEIAKAERTLEQGDSAVSYTLTQAASRRRAELQQVLDEERKVHSEQVDERLVASQEAIVAFQHAADAAKRNARRLTAVLEREQAIGVGGAGRELLEQRVGAANAAAAALQNRLSLLERAHERKQEALQKGNAPRRSKELTGSESTLHTDAASEMHASVLAPVSLLMVPHWDVDRRGSESSTDDEPPSPPPQQSVFAIAGMAASKSTGNLAKWTPMPPVVPGATVIGEVRPDTAPDLMGRRRRGAMGESQGQMVKSAQANQKNEREAQMRKRGRRGSIASLVSGGAAGLALSGSGTLRMHGPTCECVQCCRRRQLLSWRDTMLDAQVSFVNKQNASFVI